MYCYVLVEENNKRAWWLSINKKNRDFICIDKAVSMWVENSTRQLINKRRGLSIDFILDNSALYKINLINLINEGHTVLVNSCGGYHILSSKATILKEVYQETFPILNKEILNGILRANGEFLKCEYGHHYEIARKLPKNETNYISISYDNIGNNSSLFIEGHITESQKKFIRENIEKLNSIHIEEFKKFCSIGEG